MAQGGERRLRTLVRVAQMYYVEGFNQQQIASQLNISRPHISRLLADAQAKGIVEIAIHDPFVKKTPLERAFLEQFGLRDIVIVGADPGHPGNTSLGVGAAALLERLIRNGDLIGVNAGESVSAACVAVRRMQREGCRVVPLVGGLGPTGHRWQSNVASRVLADRLGCDYWQLNAPVVVSSPEAKDTLVAEPGIGEVLEMGRESTLAIVGVGEISADATLLRHVLSGGDVLEELRGLGAVANICNSFIDAAGRPVDFSAHARMIGLSVDELSPGGVVAIAAGPQKVDAISAVLRGGWIGYLVTDAPTARRVLELVNSTPEHT